MPVLVGRVRLENGELVVSWRCRPPLPVLVMCAGGIVLMTVDPPAPIAATMVAGFMVCWVLFLKCIGRDAQRRMEDLLRGLQRRSSATNPP
ncbi:MAG: hypothetical protein NTW87_03425 [Planctomycetota bacterium]|nr:hypothetical protein [Planctomycetota bacterium]